MAENSAVERFEAFEHLKSQFDKKLEGSPRERLRQKEKRNANPGRKLSHNSSGKCISDSKSQSGGERSRVRADGKAPDLVPLVETGDLLQQTFASNTEYASKNLVKGWWKNCDLIKSNHLNSPEFDAIETSSVTSCSSAYSSKSGSSFLSPQVGSCTELSDAGSCDTHQEYDIHPVKTKGLSKNLSTGAIEAQDPSSSHQVRANTAMWDQLIGEWKFESIENEASTPTLERRHRVSNEIRLPTPLGSTENLLELGSMSSLCSDSSCLSSGPPVATGTFSWKKRMSTSNLIGMFEPNSGDSNGTATLKPGQTNNILMQEDNADDREQKDILQQKGNVSIPNKNADSESGEVENGKKGTVETKTEIETDESPISQCQPDKEKEGESEAVQTSRPRPKIRSVSDRIKQLRRSQTEPELSTPLSAATHIRPSKFGDAYKVYRELQTLGEVTTHSASPGGQGKRKLVSVKERAQVFTQK